MWLCWQHHLCTVSRRISRSFFTNPAADTPVLVRKVPVGNKSRKTSPCVKWSIFIPLLFCCLCAMNCIQTGIPERRKWMIAGTSVTPLLSRAVREHYGKAFGHSKRTFRGLLRYIGIIIYIIIIIYYYYIFRDIWRNILNSAIPLCLRSAVTF